MLVLILAISPLSWAVPVTVNSLQSRDTLEEITDELLFDDTMDQFQAARNAQDPPELNWTSNGCTASPDNPLGFHFLPCCQRHDFGYRNYKAQSRFDDAGKSRIDSNFKKDMYDVCNAQDNEIDQEACKGVADLYYTAVSDLKRREILENANLEE